MEVGVPVQEFHFDSTTTTPYISAPSSPAHFTSNPLEFYYDCTTPATANDEEDDDFAFDFNKGMPPALRTAEELFEQGRIRPMKPPPPFHVPDVKTTDVSADDGGESDWPPSSVSPLPKPQSRAVEGGEGDGAKCQNFVFCPAPKPTALGVDRRKWRFVDLLLFRSSSEGHTAGASIGPAQRRAQGAVSIHYAEKRALAEEKRKQTALPYRQSFFSCLRFSRRSARASSGGGVGGGVRGLQV